MSNYESLILHVEVKYSLNYLRLLILVSKFFIKCWSPMFCLFLFFPKLIQIVGIHTSWCKYKHKHQFFFSLTMSYGHTFFITKTPDENLPLGCCFAFNFAAFSFGTNAIRESPKNLKRNDQSINSLQNLFGWNVKMAEDEAKVNNLFYFPVFSRETKYLICYKPSKNIVWVCFL